jgi:hypothetical protein
VTRPLHGDALRDAGADEIANGRASEVAWLLPRPPLKIASVCPDRILWRRRASVLRHLRRRTEN